MDRGIALADERAEVDTGQVRRRHWLPAGWSRRGLAFDNSRRGDGER